MNTEIGEEAQFLGHVEMLAGLDRVTLAKLAARLDPRSLADGATLCHQGERGDGLYLISRGKVGIYIASHPGADEQRLGTRFRGDVIGEMALLTGEGRSATVRADGDAEVLYLDRASFEAIVRESPLAGLAIAATLSRRLREANLARVGPELAAPPPDTSNEAHPAGEPSSPAVERRSGRLVGRVWLGLGLGMAIVAVGWAMAPPAGLSLAGWHALVALVAVVPIMGLGALPDGVMALMLAAVWVLGGVTDTRVALGGYAAPEWVLTVTTYAIGVAIGASGLLYRLALRSAARSPRGFAWQVAALTSAGLATSAAVPNMITRVVLAAPLTTELGEALGYRPGGRAAAGLGMAVLAGFGLTAAPFLTSSPNALLVYAILPAQARNGLDWGTWALRTLPVYLVTLVGMIAFVAWWYRPDSKDPEPNAYVMPPHRTMADALALQQAILGSPSATERIVGWVIVALLVGFVTQPLHRIDAVWLTVAALAVLAASRVVTAQTLRAVDWNFALFYGIMVSIAAVFTTTRVDAWMSGFVAATFGNMRPAPLLFVACLALLCIAVSLILRFSAAAPILTIVIAPVASGMGVNPWVVGIVALVAGNGFLFPYQSSPYQALYSGTGGRLFSHAQARPAALAYSAFAFLGLCASVPLWHAMGLL